MCMTSYLLLLFENVIELIYLLSFLQFIIKLLCLVWGKHKRDSKAFNRIFIATSSLIAVYMHNVYPRYHFGRENYYIQGNLWYSTLFKLTEVWKFAVFAIQLQQHTTCLCSCIVLLRDICFLFLLFSNRFEPNKICALDQTWIYYLKITKSFGKKSTGTAFSKNEVKTHNMLRAK